MASATTRSNIIGIVCIGGLNNAPTVSVFAIHADACMRHRPQRTLAPMEFADPVGFRVTAAGLRAHRCPHSTLPFRVSVPYSPLKGGE